VNVVFVKVFKQPEHTLVAVCDIGLVGQTFREGKLKLEVKSDFYKGNESSIDEALREVDAADIANLVGEQIVEAAVREGLVDPTAIVRISGVPHVQIVRL
jgi:hypothetical protein